MDHVFTFTIADNRIWFRNYQVNRNVAELDALYYLYTSVNCIKDFFLFIHLLLFRDIRIAAQKVLWRGFSFCAVSVAVESVIV